MFNSRRLWATAACVLLAVLFVEAGEPGNGLTDYLKDLSSALDTSKTNVARLEGCGVDKVGAECEKATGDTGEASAATRPDERRIEAALIPKNEKAAVASSAQIVNTDKQVQEEEFKYLIPGAINSKSPGGVESTYSGQAKGGAGQTSSLGGAGAAVGSGAIAPSIAAPDNASKTDSLSRTTVLRGGRRRGPCRSRNGKFPHKSPQRYYRCKGGRFVVKKCDKGLVFDPKLQYCTRQQPAPTLAGQAVSGASIGYNALSRTTSIGAGSLGAPGASGGVAASGYKAVTSAKLPVAAVEKERTRADAAKRGREAEIDSIRNKAIRQRKRGCYCSTQPTGRVWQLQHATLEQCWNEALRRRAPFLLVSSSGCQYWTNVASLTASACSGTAYHVIDVKFYRPDLARLNAGMQFWVSARPPNGVIWGTVPNVPDKPLDVRGCGELCYQFGQDFARIDHRGCRCGMAVKRTVTVRQEDLAFLRKHTAVLDPGITVQLHAGGLAGWQCTAAPANFVRITAAQSLQEALEACRLRHFKFLTPGKNGFYCGNSTDNLARFSRTQCQMNVTTTRSYSVISIQAIQRQILQVEDSIYDYVFWWVSERPPGVFWSAVLDVSQLEQCVLACNKRFVAIGPDGCFCGSLKADVTSLHVQEWVLKGTSKEGLPSQGYLMLDKQGFVNVPEGWHCTTEPTHWQVYSNAKHFKKCLKVCNKAKKAYAAFGRRGCLCGDQQDSKLRRLPMARCQDPLIGSKAYSVLNVAIWTQNQATALSNPQHKKVCWVTRKPASRIQWEAQPGAGVLEQCITTCNDQYGVTLIALGVNGCECGFTTSQVKTGSLCKPKIRSARAFLLIHRKSSSKGYTPPKFDWIVKANLTKTDHKIAVRVEPWIRQKISNVSLNGTKTIRDDFFVVTKSQDQNRTNGTDGRTVIDTRGIILTDVKDVEIISTKKNNRTKDGLTKNGQIGDIDVKSQKLVQKERKEEVNKKSEKHHIRAGANEINVKSVKDSNLTIDREIADKLSTEGYKKHFVKGHRTTQTSERFTNDANENLVRATSVSSDMLKKDVLVNQTHGDSMAMDVRVDRENVKRNTAKERGEGSSLSLEIHIEGTCYTGAANRTQWAGYSSTPGSPFKCLCSCVKRKKLFYAIYENGGNCFCADKHGLFGNNTGVITTNGECPQKGRVVYDGLKHTRELGRFCSGRKQTSISQFLQKKENSGYKLTDFRNSEMMLARANSSSLKGTHLNRTDADVSKTVHRWHGKEGTIDSRWKSRLTKGPLRNLYSLRLRVRHVHNYTERLNLTSEQDVHTMRSERGVPFRSGDKYTLTISKGTFAAEYPSSSQRRLTNGVTTTPTGTVTSKVTETPTGQATSTTLVPPGSTSPAGTTLLRTGTRSSPRTVSLLSVKPA